MITLFTGMPGVGKTAAAISFLANLREDRPLFSSGVPDLRLDHVDLDKPESWPDLVPDGAIVLIDEVQRIWRPQGPGQKIPPSIAALETHRHRGLDFILITQSPALVHRNVRSLVGRHVHIRDVGVLGRRWYEWPECAEQPSSAWKTAPINKRYRLPRKIFGMYRSATQHQKSHRSFPIMVVVALVAVLAFGVFSWRSYQTISSKISPGADVPVGGLPSQAGSGSVTGQSSPASSLRSTTAPHADAVDVHSRDGPGPIDDRIDWLPRVSSRPESAPAYDSLRRVLAMPVVSGSVCDEARCVCVTQQGTDAGLSERECRAWTAAPYFDAYRQAVSEAAKPARTRAAGEGGGEGPKRDRPPLDIAE